MDGEAFSKIILAELDAVYRLAYHLSQGHHDVDDLVQETYLRALKFAGTFQLAQFGARPWLFKILHNVIHTRLVKGQRERAVMDGLHRQPQVHSEPAGSADCSMPLDWENIDQRLKRAIADLPLSYREVFLLSAVEGLKYREIGEVIEVPVGTVMSRLSRARSMLVERLGDLAAEHGMGSESEPGKPP